MVRRNTLARTARLYSRTFATTYMVMTKAFAPRCTCAHATGHVLCSGAAVSSHATVRTLHGPSCLTTLRCVPTVHSVCRVASCHDVRSQPGNRRCREAVRRACICGVDSALWPAFGVTGWSCRFRTGGRDREVGVMLGLPDACGARRVVCRACRGCRGRHARTSSLGRLSLLTALR